VTAAAQRVAQDLADPVLDEIADCLARIQSLSPRACSALQAAAAAMLAEDASGRQGQALGRLLAVLDPTIEAARGRALAPRGAVRRALVPAARGAT